jgi:hypothetical protein
MDLASPIINSSDLQIALRDVYETTFGIHDHSHETEADALSLVAMREAEDIGSGGLQYERIRQYHEREVKKYWGLNLVEFLELPTDILTYLLEFSAKEQAKTSRVAADIQAEVERMNGEDQ